MKALSFPSGMLRDAPSRGGLAPSGVRIEPGTRGSQLDCCRLLAGAQGPRGGEKLLRSPHRKQMLVPLSSALISVPPGKLRHNKSLFLMMACQL